MKRISVIGATLTGNKGAASMLIALVQNLKEVYFSNYTIDCLTIYGEKDRRFNFYKELNIIKCTPFDIVCIAMPLSVVYYFFHWIAAIRIILLQNKVLKTIYDADLVVNIAGISYSDGRGLILLYNIACDLTVIMMQKRIFKYSQALGPFNRYLNRISAKMILPKITKIAARGEMTIKNLQELKLYNYEYCPDAAFLMTFTMSNINKEVVDICNRIKVLNKMSVGITPSSVLEQYRSATNLPFKDLMANFIDRMAGNDKYQFILFPYSALANQRTKKNNDIWIVKDIFQRVKLKDKIVYIDKEYSAEDLRYLISCCDVLITARYHGMVTALSEEVIPFVISWSHKYLETLSQFSLKELLIEYSELDINLLQNKFLNIVNNLQDHKNKITSKLPEVKQAAARNFSIIRELLQS